MNDFDGRKRVYFYLEIEWIVWNCSISFTQFTQV